MTRAFAAIVLCGLAMGVAAFVIYRENSPRSPVQAAFYQDLAQADAVVDPAAAQSMISGYRSNNGLGRVVIDADLMRLASEQARAMAARGRMDQEVGSPVDYSRITESGGDPEIGSNASEQVADEEPLPHREPTVSAESSTKSSSTQDGLVGRAIGMIRSALENGSA
jgi:hypothetical protein